MLWPSQQGRAEKGCWCHPWSLHQRPEQFHSATNLQFPLSLRNPSKLDRQLCARLPSHFNYVQLFVTLWTVAHQASPSMGFSRQEYWSGLPCPPPGDLPNPGIEPASLGSPALAGGFFTTSSTWEDLNRKLPSPYPTTLEAHLAFPRKFLWGGIPAPRNLAEYLFQPHSILSEEIVGQNFSDLITLPMIFYSPL